MSTSNAHAQNAAGDRGDAQGGGGLDAVSIHLADGVCTLSLNRPARRNAVNWDIWTALRSAVASIADDESVSVVVLTGAGGFFSAGGDRKSTPARGGRALALGARIDFAREVMRGLRELAVPSIAAVEGGAIGMGWALAACCDLIVLGDSAFLAAPFTELGLVPDGGLAWTLVHRLGRYRANQLLLTGERLDATRCSELGLVSHVAPSGAVHETAQDLARTIATLDPHAVELTKRLTSAAEGSDLASYLPFEVMTATTMQHLRESPR